MNTEEIASRIVSHLTAEVVNYLANVPEANEQDVEDIKALLIGKLAVALLT
jgi:menaquinone-dependent protoporphyrinogen IX oxidase